MATLKYCMQFKSNTEIPATLISWKDKHKYFFLNTFCKIKSEIRLNNRIINTRPELKMLNILPGVLKVVENRF